MNSFFDLEYTCAIRSCGKKLSVYDARQCSEECGKPHFSYCITCKEKGCATRFCKTHQLCWDRHLPREDEDAQIHQMIDPRPQMFVKIITHSESDAEKQKLMHQRDEQARWFNMKRDHTTGKPELYVYDRFIQLCDPSSSGNTATRHHYPSFVSFVGDTSVGKSTLVRAMLLMGITNALQMTPSEHGHAEPENHSELVELVQALGKDGPVTRSVNMSHLTDPTTLGVHLYLDKGPSVSPGQLEDQSLSTSDATYPILFSDCEGFGAGEAMTNAERIENDAPDTRGRGSGTPRNRSPSRRDQLALQLQVQPSCYSGGKAGIELFYARFLYAISDVIVFVSKEDAKIKSELIRVLEWASKAVHKSVNHPSRKTLIIVRHMANHHEPALYDVEKLKRHYLYSEPERHLWEESAVLREFVNEYNNKPETVARHFLRITNNDKLYKVLFNNITCCYIPNQKDVKGKPQELYTQYQALRALIESSVRDGLTLRAEAVMQYNVSAWSHILTRGFEHFASSEKPFDFFLAARRDNPNPRSAEDHLANFLRHAFELGGNVEAANDMVTQVTSIALLIYTYRGFRELAPDPTEIFSRELQSVWSRAIEIYQREYERCAFRFPDRQPCTSRPWKLHHQHTSAKGQFEFGYFEHERKWDTTRIGEWTASLQKIFSDSFDRVFLRKGLTDPLSSLEARLATERERSHNLYSERWKSIKSNKTCFACLQAVPDHVLGCGHSYCPRCIQELGTPSSSSECAWTMSCWLCWEEKGKQIHRIQLKPRCAGARILTLDGGGIRGIVELSVLQALHKHIDLGDFVMRDMFDLIVGTSTGGIIGLGLAMSNSTIPEMIEFFSNVSKATFSRTTAGFISKIGLLKKITTYALIVLRLTESVFSSGALREGLKTFFEKDHPNNPSIFAPSLNSRSSMTRVAVTSAKDLGQTTCLITSYNHPLGNPSDNLEREEIADKDMKIWEAALATSAAPFYLPPFEKTETKTNYVDGAVYANCPASVAYGEMEKLWPENGASLDILVSLGTGEQQPKANQTPTLVNLGFFVSLRAIFQRQLDSKSSWAKFKTDNSPQNVRSRLHRLDPPLQGDYVEFYDYERLQELNDLTKKWAENDAAADIQKIADILVANLFFFEPDDVELSSSTSSPQRKLTNPLYYVLSGSIRCRLSFGSPQVEKLLGKIAEDFFYIQTKSDRAVDIDNAQNWEQVKHPPGQTSLANVMVSDPRVQNVKRFRLPVEFVVKKEDRNMFQVLALKLRRSERKIPISGFPSTIVDLERRSKMKWLQ